MKHYFKHRILPAITIEDENKAVAVNNERTQCNGNTI